MIDPTYSAALKTDNAPNHLSIDVRLLYTANPDVIYSLVALSINGITAVGRLFLGLDVPVNAGLFSLPYEDHSLSDAPFDNFQFSTRNE